MANTTRSSNLFATEDWTKVYESFKEIDFQSYDFQTIRKSMVDYLRNYYPEDFNDYIESSEYVALIDMIAYVAQSLSFRTDLNARENFLETAERRDSILRLAKMLNYFPKRSQISRGLLKIDSVSTTEIILDSNSNNLENTEIFWGDETNPDFLEQFTTIMNASMVKTQRFGNPALKTTVGGIQIQEYNISTVPNSIPVYDFRNDVSAQEFPFEIVNGTFSGTDYLYEIAPKPGSTINTIYRNDTRGFNSVNTGFFFYFKQGTLQTLDFNVDEALPNRVVEIDVNGVDNNDVWLYELDSNGTEKTLWAKIPAITGNNAIFNSLNKDIKTLYSVQSRSADRISLVFGDGVFSNIPKGNFRVYFRVGNGFTYKISPEDMNAVTLSIPYVSHSSQIETLSVNMSLKQTVANASARENLNDVKARAQQQYYTQDRMVTGEDYQIYPFTSYNNIIKSKAVNRTSSGVSRYLDVRDTTGKYSSTNIFAEDGIFYKEDTIPTFSFTFITDSDISNTLATRVESVMQANPMYHYFLKNYENIDVSSLSITWNQTTIGTGVCTGYLKNATLNPQSVASFTSSDLKYFKEGTLAKFSAPSGYVFDVNNNLVLGTVGSLNTKSYIWASCSNVVNDGANLGAGNLDSGVGPVTLTEVIPNTAKLDEIIYPWNTSFTSTIRQTLIDNISNYKTFGIRYDIDTQAWVIISGVNLNQSTTFSLQYAGDTTGTNQDASWLFLFTNDGETTTVKHRSLEYIFESFLETRFYFDKDLKIFDPRTGKTIKDKIVMLKVNSLPDSNTAFGQDYIMNVDSTVIEDDGYILTERIKVTFPDQDSDGVIDNPDVFDVVVAPDTSDKVVFYKTYLDNSGYTRFEPVESTKVESGYTSLTDITAVQNTYASGQIFYASTTGSFYILSVNNVNVKTLTQTTDYITKTGRDNLLFQYTHNSPNNRRIDPSPSNIIDLFLLTKVYDADYRNWITDLTGSVSKPAKPSTSELRDAYGDLENYKSVSDAIVFNSVRYRPLFGDKADAELQATFKVVKNTATLVSDNEIKARIVEEVNRYFAMSNWDFGDTFYFSELGAYLHNALTPNVLSVIIVPKSSTSGFGSLYQIASNRDEIFISAATVNDVDIIDVITAAQLQASGNVVNTTSGIATTESVSSTGSSTSLETATNTTSTATTSTSASSSSSSGGYGY
jgi:hypothetical protein